MAAVQANEPTKRAKFPVQDDEFVTIRVPKETGDDDKNPDALIHRYTGEDSEFTSAEVVSQTPRNFILRAKRSELEGYRKEKENEAKQRVKSKAGIKGTSEINRTSPGIPMDQLVADLKGRVLKELSDANG